MTWNLARFLIGIAVIIGGFVIMDIHRVARYEEYYSTLMVIAGAYLSITAINKSKRIARRERNFNETVRGGLEATFRRRREED
jgi:hypothetical protein